MRWVTRERVKVDRVACPWLIRKFVDPEAEFVLLPHDTDRKHVDGTVFDVPAPNSDIRARRSDLKRFSTSTVLTIPLRLLGQIVRAADSKPANPHPAGEGLRWIAHGFTSLGLSDHELLSRGFPVYDALFAECRKRVAAA